MARNTSYSLEDVAALNRELAALVRAGLPLEPGLRQMARDATGSTRRLAAELERETSAGKTLPEAVEACGDALPRVYRASLAAGLRSGRLAAALEGLADAALRAANLRRITVEALFYPLLVVACAWLFFIFMAVKIHPSFDALESRPFAPTEWLRLSGWPLAAVVLVVPAALFAAALWWYRRSGRASRDAGGWTPGVRRSQRLSGEANFAELLAAMLSAGVPLEEALPIAAEASGLAGAETAAAELARQAAAGRPLTADLEAVRRLPPLVRLALLSRGSHEKVVAALYRAAENYRDRAESLVRRMAFTLPIAATLCVGVVVVGGYAVIALAPYFTLLHELAAETQPN